MIYQRLIRINTATIPLPVGTQLTIPLPSMTNYAVTGQAILLWNGQSQLEGDAFTLNLETGEMIWNATHVQLEATDSCSLVISHRGILDLERHYQFVSNPDLIQTAA
jgi:hypothetical protein